jgi:capsular polysaccharide export protein
MEQVLDWLILQLENQGVVQSSVDVCYAFNFSLWKRAFVKQFVGRLAKKVVFVSHEKKLESLLRSNKQSCSVLLWGRGRASWASSLKNQANIWFMEDGFLRSVGLGADLRRPSSLVIDRQGMYYDSSANSDIIDILNTVNLCSKTIKRAEVLANEIKRLAITKYNVGRLQDHKDFSIQLRQQANRREIIIVPGQFENDLSIACSLGDIKTNIGLLSQVRSDYPNGFIIFKEHPDVYSGVRPGALGEQAACQFADLYLADINMDSLLMCADRVCTLTSLTGFEALLRNKKVTVYGSPFYAGWGLTEDKLSLPNRNRSLNLQELIYGSMVKYSRYVDWNTGYLTSPEKTVAFLARQREGQDSDVLQSGWLSRQIRKVRYFIDSYFF